MILLFAACTSRPNGGGEDGVTFVDELDAFVTFDPGYEMSWGGFAFQDFDGDGVIDLFVDVYGNDEWLHVLARGPLDDVHVPSEAWVVVDATTTTLRPAELTGDDHVDLLVTMDPNEALGEPPAPITTWLVPFPFDGTIDPQNGWIDVTAEVFGHWAIDVDRDGTLDRVAQTNGGTVDETLDLTWGPIDRWDGPPDVSITPICRDAPDRYAEALGQVDFPGDLDGNGSPELTMSPFGAYGADCGHFTVSLPSTGTIDPFTSLLAVDRLSALYVTDIGDWSGDGLPDLWWTLDHSVLVSPLTLAPGSVEASAVVRPSSTIQRVTPLPFDLDDDGRAEAIVELDHHVVVVLPTDLDALTDPAATLGWELQAYDGTLTYLDGGHAWLVVREIDTDTLHRADLGPATGF